MEESPEKKDGGEFGPGGKGGGDGPRGKEECGAGGPGWRGDSGGADGEEKSGGDGGDVGEDEKGNSKGGQKVDGEVVEGGWVIPGGVGGESEGEGVVTGDAVFEEVATLGEVAEDGGAGEGAGAEGGEGNESGKGPEPGGEDGADPLRGAGFRLAGGGCFRGYGLRRFQNGIPGFPREIGRVFAMVDGRDVCVRVGVRVRGDMY